MKKFFKFQLYFSVLLILMILIYIFYDNFKLYQKEKYSKKIMSNYNITRLYSNMFTKENDNSEASPGAQKSDIKSNNSGYADNTDIIGTIEISKIGLNYPIFSTYTDELLKISPCRFYGPLPGQKGNLCIVGHNYDDNRFFGKIFSLNIGDEILIKDNANRDFSYIVNNIYEVKPINLTPVYSYNSKSTELTLITCNNLNKYRIIVKAKLNKNAN